MYWPIGAPKVYAASNHSSYSVVSSDGLESPHAQDKDGTAGHERTHGEDSTIQSTKAPQNEEQDRQEILGVRTTRTGHVFATVTRSCLSIWQTKPTAILATVIRSEQSLQAYGCNVALLLRPDGLIVVVQTEKGFLITYSLATDPNARVYQQQVFTSGGDLARRPSVDTFGRPVATADLGPGEGDGIAEVSLRFRMVIRIDAGISKALALDDELVVATTKPGAIQCIRWSPDKSGASHSTELFKKLPWLAEKSGIVDMMHDRPMDLQAWIATDGKAYAVRRPSSSTSDYNTQTNLYRGYCFHDPEDQASHCVKAAVNARFSLIAAACADCSIRVYTAKDYLGNIPLSHTLRLPISQQSSGKLTFLSYSPDGYCLFVGFEKGWATWSVYGKLGAHTFSADQILLQVNSQQWLQGIADGFWIGGGCEIMLLARSSHELCLVEMARSATTGCFATANISRSLLQASTSVLSYRGLSAPDVTALAGEASHWQTVQVPQDYLAHQWPLKFSVISPDGRYLAVAGRRGLAHHSIGSGRWRTFEDPQLEDEFTVRGGMCWYQHILVAAIDTGEACQVRLYSREKALDKSHVIHTEELQSPVVHLATSGADSLLVYTYDNVLNHFIFMATGSSIRLAQVGQISFHGIIRAPARVRAINWMVPDEQSKHGDPSQDVATASVLFLVDGKLVLLQPSANEQGHLKYDMRVIANNVEYHILTRDQAVLGDQPREETATGQLGLGLRDSLWYFDGNSMRVWPDVLDVLSSAPSELDRELPPSVAVPVDFYPLAAMMDRGILTGLESDLVQRRDVTFAFFRFSSRTHLFIPALVRHHLTQYDSPAALHLCTSYQKLPYFAHSLEVLLHNVLDDEVDASPNETETSLLANVLSFLSSFPSYHDVIVGCARKTELRSWRTLFKQLPPVPELFEESLQKGELKTAGGYLLILHAFDEESFNEQQIARLLRMAKDAGDWDLCKELSRFLMGIDVTGTVLKTALVSAGLGKAERSGTGIDALTQGSAGSSRAGGSDLSSAPTVTSSGRTTRSPEHVNGNHKAGDDYFTYARGSAG